MHDRQFGACKDRVFCIASIRRMRPAFYIITEYYTLLKLSANINPAKVNATPHMVFKQPGVRPFPSFSGSSSNLMMTLECCRPVPDT